MNILIYEIAGDSKYVDQYCIDLLPGLPIDLTEEEIDRLYKIEKDAILSFNATTLGHRIFFYTEQERKKFITWMLLKWS